ncbi:MAG: acyloxyacyl hydrolase [bacterium]|nr:acyloxyacyl hydrolase [bacterium]
MQNLTVPALLILVICALGDQSQALAEDNTVNTETVNPNSASHYLRLGFQYGSVLQTNGFVEGENNTGEPIKKYQSLCLDFGWQTDGSKDWHHLYNFPSFGVGIYGADYPDTDELGHPTSIYGFFAWPVVRHQHWNLNFDLAFGLTDNWKPYDPVNNPNNIAIGMGRSVHIQSGLSAEYKVAKQWSLIGGLTYTHFSNGGTQRPNHGLNNFGPVVYLQHNLEDQGPVPLRRHIEGYDPQWELSFTGSGGIRNLNLDLQDLDLRRTYLNRHYFVGNFIATMGKHFSRMARFNFGLDLTYDQSVADLMQIEAYKNGENAETSEFDKFDLAAVAGYEHVVHNTRLQVQLGYIFLRTDVEGRLTRFYQRLGLKQFFFENWFGGLNVRFHELGSADNLEYNMGFVSRF